MKTLNCNRPTSSEEIIRASQDEDVVLMRDGHALALVIPFDDDDLEWYARERDPEFLASIARARAQVRQGRTFSQEELKRELGLQ
jgi:hypothetical protein